jgi:hypothetical protein
MEAPSSDGGTRGAEISYIFIFICDLGALRRRFLIEQELLFFKQLTAATLNKSRILAVGVRLFRSTESRFEHLQILSNSTRQEAATLRVRIFAWSETWLCFTLHSGCRNAHSLHSFSVSRLTQGNGMACISSRENWLMMSFS